MFGKGCTQKAVGANEGLISGKAMLSRDCLFIDDVSVALDAMTDLGRRVASSGAIAVREKFLEFANRWKWTVIPHKEFAQWAEHMASASDLDWLVLDPLFPRGLLNSRMTKLRVTRRADVSQYEVESLESATSVGRLTNGIGVIDDASASGGTFLAVARAIVAIDCAPSRFGVCAASRESRNRVLRVYQGAGWRALVNGDWKIAHIRDGCPYLPFTGRRVGLPLLRLSDEISIELRAPAFTAVNNLWQVLYLDPAIRQAIGFAKSDLASKLGQALDRPATVSDLPMLGAAIPALVLPGQHVDSRSYLTQ